VLTHRTLIDRNGVRIVDAACRHARSRGVDGELSSGHALVLVRRGCFIRDTEGSTATFDPTLAYCTNPGEEQRFDHPGAHGDDCTALFLDRELVASIYGGEARLPSGALRTSPALDLEHRVLLAAAGRGEDPHALVEDALMLIASTLERPDPRPVASGRPATERARRALVDGVREALAADPERSLMDLAGELATSPHHLSRVFRSASGHTIARHRMRLRVRSALEHMAAGESELGRLAAELGFADQSHMSRVIRAETGHTPVALRRIVRT
jgi:AraC-like DNA-binding protein